MRKTADLFRTTTSVHNEREKVEQRIIAGEKGEGALVTAVVFAQLAIILCYRVIFEVGTTAWQSALPALAAAAALILPGRAAAKRGVKPFLLLPLLPALLMDMLLALTALLDLSATFLLPGDRRFALALAVCVFGLMAQLSSGMPALARLARMLAVPLVLTLLFSILTSLSVARLGNLTPILGKGIFPTLSASLFMIGCVWGAPLPILLDRENGGKKAPRALRYSMLAVGLCMMTALAVALLWPMEALIQPLSPAKRMMLLNETSASTLVWSLLVFAWILLLMLAIGVSAKAFQRIALDVLPIKKRGWIFLALPYALVLWPAAAGNERMTEWLVALSPWRAALMALTIILCLVFGGRKKA